MADKPAYKETFYIDYPSPNQRGFQILAPVDESLSTDDVLKVVYQDGERLIIRHKVPK
jgi:hypothetical protein